ncbi:MAG: hypothetical protein EA398_12045 [Deltaproteobacteria bacterium]|nr:MAG: hypothetical protein EA398_12045 [Deltaproteobacteria bacterium]
MCARQVFLALALCSVPALECGRAQDRRVAELSVDPWFCVVSEPVGLVARSCGAPVAWARVAPRRKALALGLPPCWETSGPEDFVRIRGVGPRAAERLVVFRDGGGAPEPEELEHVRGLGPATARIVAEGVRTGCRPSP